MEAFTVTYNEATTLYDIHRAGCRHGAAGVALAAATATEVARTFETQNEGCIAKIIRCAR